MTHEPNQGQGREERERAFGRREFLKGATTLASAAVAGGVAKAAASPARSAATPAFLDGSDTWAPMESGGLPPSETPVRDTMLAVRLPGPTYYDEDERRELVEVLDNRSPFRWWGSDPRGKPPDKCSNFEREFAEHQHTKYAVAVTSGTTALMTAVVALGVGPGAEVILPAWTWYACYDAIIDAGALPVFAEIDDSMDLDPADIERHITPRTKVVMAVHILGEPADMDPILEIARRHKLKVLEDCAQSAGVTYKGRPVGSMGDCGIFSFQINKTISAGEGGAVVTSDPLVFERAARFHDVGELREGHRKVLGQAPQLKQFSGGQFRMCEYTGAVMRAQLRKLDRIVADFRDKSRRVEEAIQDLPGIQFRKKNDPEGRLGNWVYIRTSGKEQRDRLMKAIRAENIPAEPMEGSALLPVVPHIEAKETIWRDWPSFASREGKAIAYGRAACPRTLDLYDRYAGVPMDPKFSDQDVADIVAAIRKVYPAVMQA